MFFRSFFLRFFQMVLAISAVYITLMAGTFYMRQEVEVSIAYLLVSAGFGCGVFVLFLFIRRFDGELTLEVGRLLYPLGILVSLVGAGLFAFRLMELIPDLDREHYVFGAAAALMIVFFVVRMFDLKWLRRLDEVVAREAPRG